MKRACSRSPERQGRLRECVIDSLLFAGFLHARYLDEHIAQTVFHVDRGGALVAVTRRNGPDEEKLKTDDGVTDGRHYGLETCGEKMSHVTRGRTRSAAGTTGMSARDRLLPPACKY